MKFWIGFALGIFVGGNLGLLVSEFARLLFARRRESFRREHLRRPIYEGEDGQE